MFLQEYFYADLGCNISRIKLCLLTHFGRTNSNLPAKALCGKAGLDVRGYVPLHSQVQYISLK